MDCLVLWSSMFRRTRLQYRHLEEAKEDGPPVKVVVGKERREFLLDPSILEEKPFNSLIQRRKKVGVVENMDSILFEHLLWLLTNDSLSLNKLSLRDVIDFYVQDV